jgi:ATP-dependent DNA helicase RecG
MNIKQLKKLVVQKESETLEFKKSTAQLHAAFETVCAFLNGQGGTVLIGVTDKEQIIGQDVADGTRQAIANETSKLEPSPHIKVDYIAIEKNKQVIALQVKAGAHAPYIYDGRAYQRNQSTTSRMSQHRYEQLLVERGQLNHTWEALIANKYSIDDLDHEEIWRAVKQGITAGRVPASARSEPIEDILASWNLIQDDELNNAAIVLFAKKTFPRYPQCHLKLGRFRGTDMLGDFIDNKEFYGNAFRMFEEANSFIMRHLPIASFFENDRFERIDKPALPVLAVREALVNAICHRDYSNHSASLTLAIFDDRMEIWNNGKLPPDLKISELKKKHKSEPRNKIIAKVFYDRKYFDGWGTGTIKIFDLCRENNVPEPLYKEYSGGIEIIFKFKEPIALSQQASKPALKARQEVILALIKKYKSISIQQLMSELVNPPSPRMVRKDLNYLKELGLIELKGSARNTFWTLRA